MATQKWHPLAAAMAGIQGTTSPLVVQFNAAQIGSNHMAAAVQDFSYKLGRIEDLVQELDNLRFSCPALASVTVQRTRVQLVFLGLEAELKFTVWLEIGKHCKLHRAQHDSDVVGRVVECLCSCYADKTNRVVQALSTHMGPCHVRHEYSFSKQVT